MHYMSSEDWNKITFSKRLLPQRAQCSAHSNSVVNHCIFRNVLNGTIATKQRKEQMVQCKRHSIQRFKQLWWWCGGGVFVVAFHMFWFWLTVSQVPITCACELCGGKKMSSCETVMLRFRIDVESNWIAIYWPINFVIIEMEKFILFYFVANGDDDEW